MYSARRDSSPARILVGLALPLLATGPALLLIGGRITVAPAFAAAAFALGVIGAAFLLTWGAELAELDVGEGLALALLALIAVLPEYAVDIVFAAKAATDPTFAPLALANMTGANRLLVGVGWSVVALVALAALRRKRSVSSHTRPSAIEFERTQVTELAFLLVASLYGLTLPLRNSLTVIDTVVLFAIFLAYLWRLRPASTCSTEASDPHAGRATDDDDDDDDSELFGPAVRIAALPPRIRRSYTIGMLIVAAAVILVVAEPFANSLVQSGRQLRVDEFLLVQWVAPLASETPEFIAVILLAWKLRAAAAIGALISSKINQWTLLVGILPLVFSVAAGSLTGLPIDGVQREELLLTASQSIFATAVVINSRLTRTGALALLGLFLTQFLGAWLLPAELRGTERLVVSAMYLTLATALLVVRRRALWNVLTVGLWRPRR